MLKARILIPLAIILVSVFMTPYFLNRSDGKPLVSMGESVDSTLSTMTTRKTYYKWQDAEGIWHFGDEVPEGVAVIPVTVDTAANILQHFDIGTEPEIHSEARASTAADDVDRVQPGLEALFNPKAAEQALNDAKAVQGLLDAHNAQIESMTR
ncbi:MULTISPECIES: DUF4124 domain-containing protein [unclassified Oceanobacter]|uniref:DUF4124 domain-containing protein n=1 Tax=unclassified Oceanobacter TaxID=2620260 RepID=UPI0026E391AD|nr:MULTISPECIES: DUF4124 domain-containing protein [unclassified Oceanobacter]MDO6680758.1 DUF4124 domain-containing protein [Oceanobacter sp. 5_MG-2023]MDP2504526.1 DUF4124 domain-containing protein [Oceanobacter sp. 3_MG-2023]MDP2547020.1 DUF4124 domain-containing protein [Oceanobacter sp. 4_MG-2023]